MKYRAMAAIAAASMSMTLASPPVTTQAVTARAAAAGPVIGNPLAHVHELSGYPDPDHYLGRTSGPRPRVFMVGDSITYRGYRANLHHDRPGWEVSTVPGRDVGTLPYYLQDRLADPARLDTVVIALGSNYTPGWGIAKYGQMVDLIHRARPRAKVVLVTTWRGPKTPKKYRITVRTSPRSASLIAYSMRRVAQQRRGFVCIANWRAYAHKHPRQLDARKVHPRRGHGTRAWTRIVTRAVARCR